MYSLCHLITASMADEHKHYHHNFWHIVLNILTTTSYGRQPPMEDDFKYEKWNISSTKFLFKLLWPNQTLKTFKMKTTTLARRPQILKVKYLSKHWLDPPQMSKTTSNERRPQIIVKYLSDISKILNLRSCGQTEQYICLK